MSPETERKNQWWLLIAVAGLAVLGLGAALALRGRTPNRHDDPGPPRMVRIPAGTFEMGSDSGSEDERPVHAVSLPSFEVDATEVTVAQYRACVAAGACRPAVAVWWEGISPADQGSLSEACNAGRKGREGHPVNCVDFEQAGAFCKWAGKRLPTEEEWEYAARGTDGRSYPWGMETPGPEHLNACGVECRKQAESRGWQWASMFPGDDGFAETAPVGSYPKGQSPFGVLDMAGNVWEWTDTQYCDAYAPPHKCMEHRVTRGGSFSDGNPANVRAGYRNGRIPAERSSYVGFRCAR
jgi:formylglycine-generating enzyme required for sulfatase activity